MDKNQSKIENVALKGLRGQGKTLNVSETLQSLGIENEQLKIEAKKKQTTFAKQLEVYAKAYPKYSGELVFDYAVRVFHADEISKILRSLTEYDIGNYGQIEDLGKFKLTTFGYAMPSAYIEDSLRIAKELDISDVDLLNFLQGYAFLFDGDALGCFYEAWDLDFIFRCNEEELCSELDDLDECRKYLIGSMIAWQSHEVLKGDCLVTVKRLAENRLSVCWRDCKDEVLDFEEIQIEEHLQGVLCDYRFSKRISEEEAVSEGDNY